MEVSDNDGGNCPHFQSAECKKAFENGFVFSLATVHLGEPKISHKENSQLDDLDALPASLSNEGRTLPVLSKAKAGFWDSGRSHRMFVDIPIAHGCREYRKRRKKWPYPHLKVISSCFHHSNGTGRIR